VNGVSFELLDAARAHAGSLGQTLLRQLGRQSVCAKQTPECRGVARNRHSHPHAWIWRRPPSERGVYHASAGRLRIDSDTIMHGRRSLTGTLAN
jgi:hypothetical protein